MLFTVPSRYWSTIGRQRYLALGGGPPRFRPDLACPALLTIPEHPADGRCAYGPLTPCGAPFQHASADPRRPGEAAAAPSSWLVQPHAGNAGRLSPPPWFGLLPLRSPLLRESSLFLGVLRCFSSPGAPLALTRCPAVRRAGCPIRISPALRLPAPPRSISPRGRVLPRPLPPRHPPCALLTDTLTHMFSIKCACSARGRATTPQRASLIHGRRTPRVQRGALSRCRWLTIGGGAAGIRTPDLRRARAALSRLSYGPSSVRHSPGGRAWTRTRDLGLIRAALSPPELRARHRAHLSSSCAELTNGSTVLCRRRSARSCCAPASRSTRRRFSPRSTWRPCQRLTPNPGKRSGLGAQSKRISNRRLDSR